MMEVLDLRKKLFLSLIILLGILISAHYFYNSGFITNPNSQSKDLTPFLAPSASKKVEMNFIPVISFYPIQVSQDNMKPLAKGIQNIWISWIQQSPSVVLIKNSEEINSKSSSTDLPNFTAFHMKKISRRLGTDFIYSARIFNKDGKVFLQPLIYDSKENTILG
ncbi:MAG: hypothetical protein JJT78_03645, partial [Leptospira sp.]|nr:hypothetical protein [Leptospira sp.]